MPPSSSARVGERLCDDLLGLLERLRGDVLQRQAAERQRDAVLTRVAVDLDQLERAAAEIADDAVRLVEAGHHAERGQFRLALAGEDVDLGAADALGLGDEGLAVLGVAAGGGRDRPELRRPRSRSHSARKRRSAASAFSTASAASRPVVCTSRPSPASTFSLKIGVGLRVSPS